MNPLNILMFGLLVSLFLELMKVFLVGINLYFRRGVEQRLAHGSHKPVDPQGPRRFESCPRSHLCMPW